MRFHFLMITLVLCLASCKPPNTVDQANTGSNGNEGGNSGSNGIAGGNGGSNGNSGSNTGSNGNAGGNSVGKEYTVSGNVMLTRSYCGGAAPSQEMLDNLRIPIPFEGLKVHARQGTANDLKKPLLRTTTTDANGNYSFKLPAGEYCIIYDERAKLPDTKNFEANYLVYDQACFVEWVKACDATVKVTDANVSAPSFTLRQPCMKSYYSNCIRYQGPYPP